MPSLLNKTTDQRILHHGTWEQFKCIQKGFDGASGVRLFYYDGAIEILMPGREHEIFSRIIGYLVTTFLAEKGIFFQPTGAMTQEKEGVVSAQADESYCIGSAKPIPDLSIEVIAVATKVRTLGLKGGWGRCPQPGVPPLHPVLTNLSMAIFLPVVASVSWSAAKL